MKQIIIKSLSYIILALMAYACNLSDSISISENPYKDDYSNITPLSNRDLWGAANVHDPAIIKSGEYYYVYSTDAYYHKRGIEFNDIGKNIGNIPIRRSKDLVNWEFLGWALDTIPSAAVEHIHNLTGGNGADNMWAPFVYKYENTYRLYYSVSSFGANTSIIGLATALSPEGPWADLGIVIKTSPEDPMNAIDASVITDKKNGRMWMHYGSYFGGLYCVELDPKTGFTKREGDLGHLVATRGEHKTRIIEAPEITYNAELDQYYLFVSYEPLFTYYNIRVGRSDSPEGPFYDYFGNNMADTTNNFPILTHSYRFRNHPGWSGNGHNAILNDNGRFFVLHQGRLAPENLMMIMHVREIKWLPDGWPVFSPQRYAGEFPDISIRSKDLVGKWEIIHLNDLPDQVELWQGQIPPGGWTYKDEAFNVSEIVQFGRNGAINHRLASQWSFDGDVLHLDDSFCAIFYGWDWENQKPALLFSGILPDGSGIWGKKIDD
ncbi:arabinan endo-1,5-alpha-L-arabinosidase [Natronoflexus pectinivorans]|uniref:Arabinan endo-1,5-alpha-L-arabinosidase n=1 Tax=Natronoflexus pectinivorans TaxID=682526 RepID=A0A4R2GNH8_9BACT|nr:arabinan endo-1,5-alpha-L-arabinosidase [Natronoflexus pectinivorans]TCO10630.1 arabinan endo-1,5-alpha-L-arabinosidase [Natronoflexus pectinivorans]